MDVMIATKESLDNIDGFLKDKKDVIEQYLAIRQLEEFKSSPFVQIQLLLREFNNNSGYHDIFIPALKELNSSYADYHKQLEIANQKLISEYPDIEKILGLTK